LIDNRGGRRGATEGNVGGGGGGGGELSDTECGGDTQTVDTASVVSIGASEQQHTDGKTFSLSCLSCLM